MSSFHGPKHPFLKGFLLSLLLYFLHGGIHQPKQVRHYAFHISSSPSVKHGNLDHLKRFALMLFAKYIQHIKTHNGRLLSVTLSLIIFPNHRSQVISPGINPLPRGRMSVFEACGLAILANE